MNKFDYKNMTPFKWFVLENFPFIENDFEAINNYRLFSKVVEYLNKTIDNVNVLGQQVEEFSNYFDNLDVQNEIDNKLDEMVESGEFQELLSNYINNIIIPLIEQQNTRISNVENDIPRIDNDILQNILAIANLNNNTIKRNENNSITMDMLTQEVKESMTGGSTAVVGVDSVDNQNIKNNAVSLYKLEELLQENFIPEFENVEFTRNLQGQIKVNNTTNKVEIDTTQTDYTYAIVDLEKDKFYNMTAGNYFVGVGIVITDGEENIIISTRSQSTSSQGFVPVNLAFRCNQTGLKCYIGGGNTGSWINNAFRQVQMQINKINLIKLNSRKLNFEPLIHLDDYMIHKNTSLNSQPNLVTIENGKVDIYKISKGIKYYVSSAMYSYIAPLVITDNNFNVSFIKKQDGTTLTPFTYEFTCEENGYMILTEFNNYTNVVRIIQEETNGETNKNWAVMGDSLSAVSTLGSDANTYIENVSKKVSLSPTNYAHGGAGYKARETNNQAFYQIANTLNNNPDLITIFGSFNDTFTTLDTSSFGTIDDTTTDTIFGCMNRTFDNLQLNYPNAIIGVIIPTPWSSRNNYDTTDTNKEKSNTYVNGLKQICEKRNIPYLDLYTKSNLYPWNESFRNSYYLNADGTHPNENGHLRFSAQIEEFLKSIIYNI
jgi:lysophospholipase L1-like esterase